MEEIRRMGRGNTMRKTKEDAAATKSALLDAAYELFYTQGFEATTLAQIAERANVTRGAVYWHFHDKNEILNELIISFMNEQISFRYLQEENENESVYDQLLGFYHRPPEILKKMFFINRTYGMMSLYPEFKPLAEKVQSHKRFLYGRILSIVEQAVQSGRYTINGSSESVAMAFFMIFENFHIFDSYEILESKLSSEELKNILRLLIVEK